MKIIGLTGGSGAGKGYVAALFSKCGVPSLDCDQVSRAVCAKESPCLKELASLFGEEILLPDGSYHRKRMGEIVYSDPEKRALLNSVTHRYILDECRKWLAEREAEGCPAAIIDAPLLFESGFDRECGVTVAVLADLETRIGRIVKRDGITEDAARLRIAAQHDDGFYLTHCDHVIMNHGTTEKKELLFCVGSILAMIGV